MRARLASLITVATLAVAAAGFSAAPAMAQRGPVTTVATVAQPFSEATRIITGTTVWNCEGDTCRATSAQTANVRACRQLARETGTIAGYAAGDAVFSADQLASCNSAARPRS